MTWHSTYTWPLTQWHVDKGSETYTLKEFIESGRFCAIYGHDTNDARYTCGNDEKAPYKLYEMCRWCAKCFKNHKEIKRPQMRKED